MRQLTVSCLTPSGVTCSIWKSKRRASLASSGDIWKIRIPARPEYQKGRTERQITCGSDAVFIAVVQHGKRTSEQTLLAISWVGATTSRQSPAHARQFASVHGRPSPRFAVQVEIDVNAVIVERQVTRTLVLTSSMILSIPAIMIGSRFRRWSDSGSPPVAHLPVSGKRRFFMLRTADVHFAVIDRFNVQLFRFNTPPGPGRK